MTKYTCTNCGQETELVKGLKSCPACESAIEDFSSTVEADTDIIGSIDTAKGGATISGAGGGLMPGEDVGAASDRTMMPAELGYVDKPIHMKTMELPESAYPPIGGKSSIPHRTVADAEATNGELRDYKLIDKLGSGSFGVVYRALQVPLDRSVAIKVLRPLPHPESTEGDESKAQRHSFESRVREEFLREAQFTGKLEHPNIVPIHDIGLVTGGEQSDRPFYVMKEIKGISWQDVINEKTRDENMDIFSRVVDAIGFAHSHNILHCDLKPENVMLGEFGEVLVVDWGQAIDVTRPETYRPGGSPAYCSPEMATYWCNFATNPSKADAAKREIGPRSDVYLLGAILFQIVTGRPPHFGLKGETPADVMRRASFNEIRKYDNFVGDELLSIALDALRLETGREIVTVTQLKEALKSYESRRQSIELRDRAFELLKEAKSTSDYDTYQKAKFGFEESLQLWSENPTAQQGLEQTRLSAATLALKDQNFDLGLDMLNVVSTKEESDVKTQLQTGKKKRDKRKGLVRLLSLLFVLAILGGIAANYTLTQRSIAAQKLADEKTKEAEKATIKASQEQEKAKVANEQAAQALAEKERLAGEVQTIERDKERLDGLVAKAGQDLETARMEAEAAERAKEAAETAKQMASMLAAQAQTQLEQAKTQLSEAELAKEEARKNAEQLKEGSKLLSYKSKLIAILQRAEAEDFNGTRLLLDAADETTKSTMDWRRLNLLAHPEITSASRYPDEELLDVDVNDDRNRIAFAFRDRVEICNPTDLQASVKKIQIQLTPRNPIALNADGTKLAIGIDGSIRIYDLNNEGQVIQRLAQSYGIIDIDFSNDGSRLLSIGEPDPRNRSIPIAASDDARNTREHELMVWDYQDGNWLQLSNPRFKGVALTPVMGTFSADGERILITNKAGSINRQTASVLAFVEEASTRTQYYELISNSPLEGIVTSIFADEQGQNVISSVIARDELGQSNQIVFWNTQSDSQANASKSNFKFVSLNNDWYGRVLKRENVDATINDLDLQKNRLVAVSDDNKISVWQIDSSDILTATLSTPQKYGGHARPIDSCAIISKDELITVSTGVNPEIIKINQSKFQSPNAPLNLLGDSSATLKDQSSPTVAFEAQDSGLMIGNDHGLVSFSRSNPDGSNQLLKWQVTAWEQHFVTPNYLFARSSRDLIYQYDLESGELVKLYREFSEVLTGNDTTGKIRFMTVSEDGSTLALQRTNDRDEIEVWNLQTLKPQTISFAELLGMRSGEDDAVKELPQMALSPSGNYLAAGKIRFHVWETQTGRNLGTDADLPGFSRDNLSALTFIDENRIATGQRRKIRVFQVGNGLNSLAEFPGIDGLPELINSPNIVDTRVIDGVLHAMIRKTYEEDKAQGLSRSTGLQIVKFDLQSGTLTALYDLRGFLTGTFEDDQRIIAASRDESRPLIRHNFLQQGEPVVLASAKATNIESYGGLLETRFFNDVYTSARGKIVLQWNLRSKLDPTKRDYSTITLEEDAESEGQLKLVANPIIKQVGSFGDTFLTLDNQRIRRWKMTADKNGVLPGGIVQGQYRSFSVAPNQDLMVAIESNGKVAKLVRVSSNELVSEIQPFGEGEISFATISPDQKTLLAGSTGGQVALVNLENQNVEASFSIGTTAIQRLSTNADGQVILAIVAGDQDNGGCAKIVRRNADTGDWAQPVVLEIKPSGSDSIVAGDLSTDGNRLVTGTQRGLVTLWNIETQVGNVGAVSTQDQRELLTLHQFQSEVRDITIGEQDLTIIALEAESADGTGLKIRSQQ